MYHTIKKLLLGSVFAAAASPVGGALADGGSDAEAVLQQRCGGCHQALPDGGLSRISEGRRTPEGWDMTVVRMMLIHGVEIEPTERRELVKYLADTYGLAPAETRDFRYILERRPAVVENPPDAELATLCARCHSYARVALQRRDADDWRKLSHFHLGQHPSTEYQALARDRNWWEIASTETPEQLAGLYPLQTEAWSAWQAADRVAPAGDWRVVGHQPGKGRYSGKATISAGGDAAGGDSYQIDIDLTYADGSQAGGSGSALLYAGYEWRGRLTQGDDKVLQVFALSEDGNRLEGRWFLDGNDALGGDMTLRRADGPAALLAVEPPYLKTGESAELTLHGVGLATGDDDGAIDLGDGVDVVSVSRRSADTVTLKAKVAADAASGPRAVSVGGVAGDGLLTVYDSIDSLRVEPDYAIARVGGNGGPVAPVPAQFDAAAYIDGPDGETGTDDDIRLGVMPASWSVDNANEIAADMQDKRYAGELSASGLFMPAGAGPNPERRYGTNNVGELAVTATIDGAGADGAPVSGSARLIVTVQRWNDPPIR